jgi:hypothetical protein
LDLTFELIAAAVDNGKVIVSKLTPLLLDLAFHLFPISLDPVPVHGEPRKVVVAKRRHEDEVPYRFPFGAGPAEPAPTGQDF